MYKKKRACVIVVIFAIFCLLTNFAAADCRLTEAGKQVIMENNYLKLVIQPGMGGKGSSLIYKKTGDELTNWPQYGILEDRFWIDRAGNNFVSSPYAYKVIKNNNMEITLRLSCRGKSAGFRGLFLEKSVSIFKNSSSILVNLNLYNKGKFQVPIGLWSFQQLALVDRGNKFFAPTQDGVNVLHHYKTEGQWHGYWDRFLYDFSRGWTGFVSDNGTGAVCIMDPSHVSCLYNCGRRSRGVITTEWIYNKFLLNPGKLWKTSYTILPFSKFTSIDGAGNDMAGGIEVAGKPEIGKNTPVKITLISGDNKSIKLNYSVKCLPEEQFSSLKQASVQLKTSETAERTFQFSPQKEGTYVLRFEIIDEDNLLFDMERAINVGIPSGRYHLARNFKRVGEEMAKFRKRSTTSLRIASYIEHKMVSDYVTPHLSLGKPYYKGKTSILMSTCPQAGRELIELDQRMDIDYSFIVETRDHLNEKSRWERWESKLRLNPDVIFIEERAGHGRIWAGLLPEIQKKILKQVEKGAGMVYLCMPKWWKGEDDPLYKLYRSSKVITAMFEKEVPFHIVPNLNRKDVIKEVRHGKGTILFLNYARAKKSKYKGNVSEYYYAFLTKVILYAAGKSPDILVDIKVEKILSLAELEVKKAELLFSSSREFNGEVIFTTRNSFGEILVSSSKPVKVKQGDNRIAFPLSSLSGGLNVCDVQLKDEKGNAITWASKTVTVETPVHLAEFQFNKDVYTDGEKIKGSLIIQNKSSEKKTLYLLSELWDTEKRLIKKNKQTVTLEENRKKVPIQFQLTLSHPLTRMHTVKVKLSDGKKILDELHRDIITRPVEKDSFYFIGYKAVHHRLSDFGFNAICSGRPGMGKPYLVWADVPISFKNPFLKGKSAVIRRPCLTDPKFLNKVKNQLKSLPELYDKYDVLGHLLIDEWAYDNSSRAPRSNKSDLCHSHSCIRGFQEYLKEKYKDVNVLNQNWESSYESFNEIEPVMYSEIRKKIRDVDRNKKRKFVDWLDHQLFKEKVIADFFGYCLDVTGNRINFGVSGTFPQIGQGYFVGYDWWKAFGKRNMRLVSMYAGLARSAHHGEIIRSFSRPEDFIADWSWGYDREDTQEKNHTFGPWYLLFHEADGITYYIDEWTPYAPMLYPDWTPRNQALWLKQQADLINREGIGKLVREAKREKASIAVHYSQASLHANRLLGMIRGSVPLFDDNWGSMVTLIRDSGLQINFISYEEVEQGRLSDYKVFIMPFSYLVSEQEAKEIEKFVRKGGIVICDVLSPELNKMLGGADLSRLFGIEQEGFPSFRLEKLKIDNDKAVELQIGIRKINLTSGKPLAHFTSEYFKGTTPAMIVNDVGLGKAIYLNFSLANYRSVKAGGVGGEIAAVTKAKEEVTDAVRGIMGSFLLKFAEMDPKVRITITETGKSWAPEIIHYRKGEAEYVGILRCEDEGRITYKDKKKVKIEFGKKAHIYDIINKVYYGKTDNIETVLTDGKASLFALLPHQVIGLNLQLQNKYNCGELIQAELSVNGEDSGVAILSLKDPSGKERYRSKVSIVGGKAKFKMPIALNDPPGKWRAEAVDVVSGEKAAKFFQVLLTN